MRLNRMEKVKEYIPVHYMGKRVSVKLDTGKKTIVEQCHRETTDINKIIGRYRKTGIPPVTKEPTYADVSEVGEMLDVRMKMSEAQEQYESLPDFIKEKLPFADIGNVDNETLEAMFNVQTDTKEDTPGDDKSSEETGESEAIPRGDTEKSGMG